uniref:Uncharacterized protein n=1 Tax=Sphaerodactylus townsendi TaxID=933632 RepID=A0ACB8GAC2_9SAUR
MEAGVCLNSAIEYNTEYSMEEFYYVNEDANEDPGEDVALLSVSFEDTEATQVFPKLYLSPRIEQNQEVVQHSSVYFSFFEASETRAAALVVHGFILALIRDDTVLKPGSVLLSNHHWCKYIDVALNVN